MEDEKPDTRHLVLKPKEIIPTDTRAVPGDGTAISVRLIHRENQLAEQRAAMGERREFLQAGVGAKPAAPGVLRPREVTALDPPSAPGDPEAISVPGILLQNRIAEDKSGWGRLRRWKKRKSRRTRDFIVFVGGTDLLLVILMATSPNVVSVIYGVAALVLVTSMFGWIMFFVMDDY